LQQFARREGVSVGCDELYGGYATYGVVAKAPPVISARSTT
jgi:hypothetical protein